MITYIGSEYINSPLANSAEDNFIKIKSGETAISFFKSKGINKEDLYLAKFKEPITFYKLLSQCIENLVLGTIKDILTSKDTIIFISTTKGDIEQNMNEPIIHSAASLKKEYNLKNEPITISNACVSGVLAMNLANSYLKAGICKYAFVIGADVISDFVLYGFQSLYAISDEPCRPFDNDRKGITLGEGAAGVIMSSDAEIFKSSPLEFVEGTSSNDANHISGPSRTGEGLYRTIQNTLELANVKKEEIDFISAHGTGTAFNDEMESIAFDRLGLTNVPINSLKGFFGHTLGAAGIIETAISMQGLRNNCSIKSLGYENKGVSGNILIQKDNIEKKMTTLLKTASGFGGCNVSAIIKTI